MFKIKKIKQDKYEREFQRMWKSEPRMVRAINFLQKGELRALNKRLMIENGQLRRMVRKVK